MVKVKINGIENDVQEGVTILQACEEAGLEIPRFCYCLLYTSDAADEP